MHVADIDECANNTDGCAQTCTNTVGSYQCSCETGYTLNSDGHACDGTSSPAASDSPQQHNTMPLNTSTQSPQPSLTTSQVTTHTSMPINQGIVTLWHITLMSYNQHFKKKIPPHIHKEV